MATKRQRSSGHWEFIVKRKGLLATPLYLTFDTEAEGDAYVRRLEALLDKGIVPDEFKKDPTAPRTVAELIRKYLAAQRVAESDLTWLKSLWLKLGTVRLQEIDYAWTEAWISQMKRDQHLAPSTIRHYVGALARSLDWAGLHGVTCVTPNPLRNLPQRYAVYTDVDVRAVNALGKEAPEDVERDRRLVSDEEARIRRILAGDKPDGRERPLELRNQAALECLFDLALESAMRMREMFTAEVDQVDFERRTIFLDKTENGDKRQVPMTSVALRVLKKYVRHVKRGECGMDGFAFEGGRLFPWWDGTPPSLAKTTALFAPIYF